MTLPQPGTLRRRAGTAALAVYGAGVGAYVVFVGLPTDAPAVVAVLVGGLILAALRGGGPRLGRVLLDWVPFGLLLFGWNWSRGIAVRLHMPVHVTPGIEIDRWLGFGRVPTVWLQHTFGVDGRVHAWELLPSLVYVTHFIASYLLAVGLWLRDRARWVAYVQRFATLTVAGLVTYVALPWAPPWLAAQAHHLPAVHRTSTHGWTYLHLGFAASALSAGQAAVNLNAALPSLHAGFALLIALVLWEHAGRAARIALAAYPLAMGFTLVLTGEHYVGDVLLGYAYAAAVHVGWCGWERRRVPQMRSGSTSMRSRPGGRGVAASASASASWESALTSHDPSAGPSTSTAGTAARNASA